MDGAGRRRRRCQDDARERIVPQLQLRVGWAGGGVGEGTPPKPFWDAVEMRPAVLGHRVFVCVCPPRPLSRTQRTILWSLEVIDHDLIQLLMILLSLNLLSASAPPPLPPLPDPSRPAVYY